jgi:predicted membrane-bound spermidine synthase
MVPLLLFVFMLSGAAGLFYESVWSRYLSLFVGHSAYAQVITLVLFLGGMAVGAMLVARRTERIRDPLYAYAIIELVIGVIGMLFHDAIYLPVTSWAYASVFPALAGGAGLTAVKWMLAGALILPQSILLGATFPLMSAGVLRRVPREPGRVLSLLYFANSFGAAVGVLIAGFVLFQLVGLPGTLQAAAILNLLVALAAILISRLRPIPVGVVGEEGPASRAPTGPSVGALPASVGALLAGPIILPIRPLTVLLLAISAGTAVASFIYEIAWIRMLSLVIGSATHSFELMLSAFIFGLSMGAFWVRRRADRFVNPLRTLAIVQLLMGAFALLSLVLYSGSFTWAGTLMAAVSRADEGYVLFSIAKYAICLAIMLPATFCAGITLPLITRTILAAGGGERTIGSVYAFNTFGSIIGISLAALVLMPALGLKGLLILGGVLDMALGVVILAAIASVVKTGAAWRVAALALAVTVVLQVGSGLGVTLDPDRMASAVFRQGLGGLQRGRTMLYEADGRTASIHAFSVGTPGTRIIATNGKPDGSLAPVWFSGCPSPAARTTMGGDDGTQALLGIMSYAFHPSVRHAAVIGHGTGMTSHFLLASPVVEEVVTIEIEPRIVDGSRIFEPANRRVFDDPRSVHVFDDAKSYFAAANRRFDLILSEPSNPWVSGVSGLFTTEFYERVKRYVAPDGLFGQWLHAYELSDGLVLSVLSALHANFADYRVYAVSSHDVLVVASPEGTVPEPDWSVFAWPEVQTDLCAFHPVRPAHLDAALVADKAGLDHLFAAVRATNSDFYPVLDLGAEQARFRRLSASGVMSLGSGIVPLGLANGGPGLAPDTARLTAFASLSGARGQSVGAWLRHHTWGAGTDTTRPVAWDESLRFRHTQFRRGLEGARPPSSWLEWSLAFSLVAMELQEGTRRWVDERFYGEVEAYLERARAPQEPRHAVAFHRAQAAGDLAAAAPHAAALVSAARQGVLWVPADDLLDGAVMAHLAVGDSVAAGTAWNVVRRHSIRNPAHARLLSLATRLRAAGVLDTPGAAPAPVPETEEP